MGPTGSWHYREWWGTIQGCARGALRLCVLLRKHVLIDAFSVLGAQDVLLVEERLNAAMRFDIEDADAEHDNIAKATCDRSMSGEAARVLAGRTSVGELIIRFASRDRCEETVGESAPARRHATGALLKNTFSAPSA